MRVSAGRGARWGSEGQEPSAQLSQTECVQCPFSSYSGAVSALWSSCEESIGPCLLITTNWVNAEMISLSLPLHSLPPQRQLRDTERSQRDFSKWRQASVTWCEYQAATAPGKGRGERLLGGSERGGRGHGAGGWGLRSGGSSHFPSLASSRLSSGAAEVSRLDGR